MRVPPNLLEATLRMDMNAIRRCLDEDPSCIEQDDEHGRNAMHLCVGGGSPRMKDIMKFFIEETDINLLHEDEDARCPLEMAIALNDVGAVELLEEPTHRQLSEKYPDSGPDLELVPNP